MLGFLRGRAGDLRRHLPLAAAFAAAAAPDALCDGEADGGAAPTAAAAAATAAAAVADEPSLPPQFVGVFLDKDSRALLKKVFYPAHARKLCDHATLRFDPDAAALHVYEPLCGAHATLQAVGLAEDAHGQALLVDITASGSGGRIVSANRFPHVTLTVTGDGEEYGAVYSNVLLERLHAAGALGADDAPAPRSWQGELPAWGFGGKYAPSKASFTVLDPPLKLEGVVCTSEAYDVESDECHMPIAPTTAEERAAGRAAEAEAEAAAGEEATAAAAAAGGEGGEGGAGGEEEEEVDENGPYECGFCLWMRAGPCGDVFRVWEKCLEHSRDNDLDFVEECGPATLGLKLCVDKHPEYYEELSADPDDAVVEVQQEEEGGGEVQGVGGGAAAEAAEEAPAAVAVGEEEEEASEAPVVAAAGAAPRPEPWASLAPREE